MRTPGGWPTPTIRPRPFSDSTNTSSPRGCAKRDLLVAVSGAGLEFEAAVVPIKDELRDAIGALLGRAQAVGAVRPDVTAAVVTTLAGATCQASAHQGNAPPAEVLTVVFDGLRARPG